MQKNALIREEHIRPEDVFGRFLELSAEDALNFFDRSQFIVIDCPGCGSTKTDDRFDKFGFTYNHCSQCGSIYVSPRPNLTELNRYYAVSRSQKYWSENVLKKTGDSRKEHIMIPNVERIEKILSSRNYQPKSILDIGSASGIFLMEWKKKYPQAILRGIEPGRESAQKCRDLGIETYERSVEEQAKIGGVYGDLVTCFEVIEHTQDPQDFAKSLYDVTAEDGICINSCLGSEGFDIQVLWEKSRSLMPPYHLNFLSVEGLQNIFMKAGFKEVNVFTPGRLDFEIVMKAFSTNQDLNLSRFEKLLLKRGLSVHKEFQKFLSENCLSSHVWIVCKK